MPNRNILRNIRVGDIITAELLNEITSAVNSNTLAVSQPKQVEEAGDDFEKDEGNGESSGLIDLNLTETAKTQTTVTVTDSNGDTHDIEQRDTITLTDGSGNRLVLNFDNS